MPTEDEIQQIKIMYLQKFGKNLTDEQAIEYAKSLLDLMRAVYC